MPVLIVLGLCAGLLAAVAFVAGDDGDESAATTTTTSSSTTSPTTTTTTTTPPQPIPLAVLRAEPFPEDVPASYRITYDLVENSLAREEVWAVERPYSSLITSTRDGEQVSGSATSPTALYTYLSDRDAWLDIQPERHRAVFDIRPLTPLAAMIELGLVVEVGEDEYTGRPCRRFETGAPLSTSVVTAPSDDERTTFCLDAAGLVLHERWTSGGAVLIERTAREVEIDPVLDGAQFDPTPLLDDVPELDALLSTVAVAADDETLAGLRTDFVLPDGYTFDGAVFRSGTSESVSPGASEVVRFYSRGPDLIEIAELRVDGDADLSGGGARPVEVEGFDEVWFDPDFRASMLRARVSDSRFVELRGAEPRRLLDILTTVTVREPDDDE